MTRTDRPIRVILAGDSPTIQTGFGLVMRQICNILQKTGKYELEVYSANNHELWYDRDVYPYKIYSTPKGDPYNTRLLHTKIEQGDFDILFMVNDIGILNETLPVVARARGKGKQFTTIFAALVDTPLTSQAYFRCLTDCDYPVVFTQFAFQTAANAESTLRKKLQCIFPGCEPDVFFPLPEEDRRTIRKEIFGVEDEDFLVVNVNRNQWRNDPARSLKIFHEFHKQHPKSRLYMHCKAQTFGGDLMAQAAFLSLKTQSNTAGLAEVLFTDSNFNVAEGVPRSLLNNVYNAADVLISTSEGKGWGLSLHESFCAKTPVIFPNNTSITELIGEHEERGYLAACGATEDSWVMNYGLSNVPRMLVSERSMLEKLEKVYGDKRGLRYVGETADKIEQAYAWATERSWTEHIARQWLEIFAKASTPYLQNQVRETVAVASVTHKHMHVSRGREISKSANYFDEFYEKQFDPWDYETSSYEREKYATTLVSLPQERYRRAFDVGCSIGVLTELLARRCDELLAVDISQVALERAKKRCSQLSHVSFSCMNVPKEFPSETFDLILLSEVACNWSSNDLALARQLIISHLQQGGHLLLVDWTGDPLADDVHDFFLNTPGSQLRHLKNLRAKTEVHGYRLDLFVRT